MSAAIYLACVAGTVSRTLVPFLLTLKDNPATKFDRKFLLPAAIAVLINLLVAPFVFSTLPTGASWIVSYMVGWGATDISREALKAIGGTAQSLSFLK
jgi:hypothetical protein